MGIFLFLITTVVYNMTETPLLDRLMVHTYKKMLLITDTPAPRYSHPRESDCSGDPPKILQASMLRRH